MGQLTLGLDHRGARRQSPGVARDGKRYRLYVTRAWRLIRAEQLEREPRCQWMDAEGVRCEATTGDAVMDVDHILPIGKGGTEAPENLQTLCHRHHSLKTALEVQGRTVQDFRRCARCRERYPDANHLCPDERKALREVKRRKRESRLCEVCQLPLRRPDDPRGLGRGRRHRSCYHSSQRKRVIRTCPRCGNRDEITPGHLRKAPTCCAPGGRPQTTRGSRE
jgi:hypothetical protein